jgi:hypothetical protein
MAESWKDRQAIYKRRLQKLGGMVGKGLCAPQIYAAVERALREDPKTTPQGFWDRIGADDEEIFKSTNAKGREVIKCNGSGIGITFSTLREYFRIARRVLVSH